MQALALSAIAGYQRYLSPHKGFCCAYREWTGGRSCSVLGQRAIRRFGVIKGIAVLRSRFGRCGVASNRLQDFRVARQLQRGIVDCGGCDVGPCDTPSCELPDLHCPRGAQQLSTCCDCGSGSGDCGNWGNKNRRQKEPKEVHIPPGRWQKD